MSSHAGSAAVQEHACAAVCNMTYDDAKNRTRAGEAGAVEAVVAAMGAHAGSAGLQEQASRALRSMTSDDGVGGSSGNGVGGSSGKGGMIQTPEGDVLRFV